MTNLYQYNDDFFAYQQVGSLSSAKFVVPFLLQQIKARSVLDVGCGAGAWVATYLESGMTDVLGVDGDYINRNRLLFDESRFRAIDITKPFHLQKSFDLAQCLEVAEHIDPSASETMIDNLVAHAPIVIFSAAPPGQGGENHINEKPYEYWRDLFLKRDYFLFDFIRPAIKNQPSIESWYRYNILAFVKRDEIARLPRFVTETFVAPDTPVKDVSPLLYRMRRKLLSLLPPPAVTRLALLKHKLALNGKPLQATVK